MSKRPDVAPRNASPDASAKPSSKPAPAAAAPGTLVPSQPIGDGRAGAAAPRDPAPAIESTLVGSGGTLPPMNPRPAAAEAAPLRLEAAAGAGTPAPDKAAPGGDKPGANASTAGKPADKAAADAGPRAGSAPAKGSPATPASLAAAAAPASSAPIPAAPPAAPPPRRGGFAPMVLGGIVAAGLGAGAAWVAIPRLPAAWQPGTSTPAPDPAALTEAAREAGAEAARTELARSGAEIESRAVEAAREAAASAADASLAQGGTLLEQARQAGAEAATKLLAEAPAGSGGEADPSVQAALAAQAQQLAALDKALNDALADLRAAPAAPAGAAASADVAAQVAALERQLAEQASALAALAERPAVDPDALAQLRTDAETATARIREAAEQAQAQLAQVESRTGELAAAADEAARRARAASAAIALSEALQTGAPRQQALSTLAEAGVEPAPALTGELPSLEALAEGFVPAARAALRDARAAEPAQSAGSAIGNFLRAQTSARSVTPREGTDADAVLSRADDAVQRGAIAEALDELATLPEPARPAMADWTAQAQAYVAAQQALGALVAPPAADADDVPGGTQAPAEPQPAAVPSAAAPSN